jgi:hypothetical protein
MEKNKNEMSVHNTKSESNANAGADTYTCPMHP